MPPAIAAVGALAAAAGTATAGTAIGTATVMGMSASTLMTVAGTALSVAGMVTQGIQDSKVANANAKAAKYEAQHTQALSAEDARRQRERNSEATSTQIAKLGKSGVDFMGSPLDLIMADAGRGELAARDIEVAGKNAGSGKEYEARITKWKATQQNMGNIGKGLVTIGGKAISNSKTILGGSSPLATGYGNDNYDWGGN
jgi:hypothetical protein